MSNYRSAILAVVLLLGVAPFAMAQNTLEVTDVDPLEGNFSMRLNLSNNSNKTYVQDNSPDFETVEPCIYLSPAAAGHACCVTGFSEDRTD